MDNALNSSNIDQTCAQLLASWGEHRLIGQVEVSVSPRLKTTIGLADVRNRRIRLNKALINSDQATVNEVLCHELAHIVVFERHGRAARPHGKEWQALLYSAGYPPRTRMPAVELPSLPAPAWFEHYCPVCQAARLARRRMSRWRCHACLSSGLDGKLAIERIVP